MKVGQVPLIKYFHPGDAAAADAVAANPFDYRAVLLANHGQIAAGADLDDAVTAAIELTVAYDRPWRRLRFS